MHDLHTRGAGKFGAVDAGEAAGELVDRHKREEPAARCGVSGGHKPGLSDNAQLQHTF